MCTLRMIVTPGMHKALTRNLNKPYMNYRNHETKWRPEHSRYQIEGRRVFKLTASTIRNTLRNNTYGTSISSSKSDLFSLILLCHT